MTDIGKKPFKFTLIKRTPEEPVIVLSSDFIDRSIPWNELIEVQEVTPCPNCERLAGHMVARLEALDEKNVRILELENQLEMCKEALEFYTCKDNYLTRFISMSCGCCSTEKEPEILEDVGKVAAECLAKLEGMKAE